MLTLTDLTVQYPGAQRPAVDGASLTLEAGEVVALLGPSGCGKSSLLRAIAGLEAASGSISWDGADLAGVPVHERGFGLMFQEGQLFPHRTAGGNVAFGLQMAGMPRPQRRERVNELLELVGLSGYAGRRITTLSGGEQQRVALARSLAPKPKLLLLDEPLSALDRHLRERLAGEVAQILRATGTTAIYVTHDQDEAFAVADRVALMRAGQIVQAGTPAALATAPTDPWAAAFLGYRIVEHAGQTLALGPRALEFSPGGALQGFLAGVGVWRGEVVADVDIPGWGRHRAITGGRDLHLAVGERIELALNERAIIRFPAEPTARTQASVID